MRSGVMLPIFQHTPARARRVALAAEAAGVDGVFCYDHLWPLGQPGRPALAPFPVLAVVARATERVALGTLVARVGLVPDAVLVAEFDALSAVAPGRVVAGLGTGDRLSGGENEAYGVAFELAAQRRSRLRACVRRAIDRGLCVWIGGGAAATREIAVDEGAALNLWGASAPEVKAAARSVEVTWGGPAPRDLGGALGSLAAAGATWVVAAWPVDLDELVAAARACSAAVPPPTTVDPPGPGP